MIWIRRPRFYVKTAVKCTFCHRLAFAPQYIKPPLCAKHHEMMRIVSSMRRRNCPVTLESALAVYDWQVCKHAFTRDELPGLLIDVIGGGDNGD